MHLPQNYMCALPQRLGEAEIGDAVGAGGAGDQLLLCTNNVPAGQ